VTRAQDVGRQFSTIPLLRALPPASHARLAASAREWSATHGTVVFDVGDACRDLALTSEGVIRVSRPLANGHDVLLYRLQPGEPCIMSTACFLGHAAYPVRGVVEQDVRGVILPGADVQAVLVEASGFREALFGAFVGRLGSLLTLLVERGPVLHATHQQLADELVSSREVVSRLLESFEVHGYVHLQRARVEVSNPRALADLASG
jgi:CRP/FNR family transcriptional regulator, anaerobic regulatory protein